MQMSQMTDLTDMTGLTDQEEAKQILDESHAHAPRNARSMQRARFRPRSAYPAPYQHLSRLFLRTSAVTITIESNISAAWIAVIATVTAHRPIMMGRTRFER